MAHFSENDQFDLYTLQKLVGRGATAEVWKVSDRNGRTFALKILAPEAILDEITLADWKREFQRAVELRHPAVLPVHLFDVFEGRPFILMNFMEQGSLTTRLRERLSDRSGHPVAPPFTERELAGIIAQVSDALVFLESRNILHLDIKPDNILLDRGEEGERYLITDFGISAELRNTILRMTRSIGQSEGGMTPAYAAPERFRGEVNPKSDVFSLGIMLYELAIGKLPMADAGIPLGMALNNGAGVPELPGEFSRRFKALVNRCLHKDPLARCTARELLEWSRFYMDQGYWPEHLGTTDNYTGADDIRETQLIHGNAKTPLPPSPLPPTRPNPWGRWALLMVVLLAGGYALSSIIGPSDAEKAEALWKAGQLPAAAQAYRDLCPNDSSPYCDMAARLENLDRDFDLIGAFSSGMALVQDRKTSLYGYVDTTGQLSIPAQYEQGRDFNDHGLAAVARNGMWGVIDRLHKTRIPLKNKGIHFTDSMVILHDGKAIPFTALKK